MADRTIVEEDEDAETAPNEVGRDSYGRLISVTNLGRLRPSARFRTDARERPSTPPPQTPWVDRQITPILHPRPPRAPFPRFAAPRPSGSAWVSDVRGELGRLAQRTDLASVLDLRALTAAAALGFFVLSLVLAALLVTTSRAPREVSRLSPARPLGRPLVVVVAPSALPAAPAAPAADPTP